jgi:hypothetical protein
MKVNIGKYPKIAERRVSVDIEPHDTYSFDHTLALIILPALLQLRETQHGIPSEFAMVGGEDYDSQDSFDFYKETNKECFDQAVERWNEVLDKMIWSFQQLVYDNYEEKYHHGKTEYDWIKDDETFIDPFTGKSEEMFTMVDKHPDKHWTDYDGMRLHEERIQEGLELFGKYYQHLWD